MIYVNFLGGVLFIDSDVFDFKVREDDDSLYIFDDRACIGSFNKHTVFIQDDHDDIIYKGDTYDDYMIKYYKSIYNL